MPKMSITLSENDLRALLVEFYLYGRREHHYDKPHDNAIDHADGWIAAHEADFQLEKQPVG